MSQSLNQVMARHDPLAWATWPQTSPEIEAATIAVLRSGRWAISGMSAGRLSEEQRFAAQFADYIGVATVAPTASGSSALVVALQACGIGYGDEVLVPGLAWVACASAVVRVGAIPIFVDVDPQIYAMDPVKADSLVTPRTAAVLVTHLSSSLADMDAFEALAIRHGIAMVEDCSQAHGAMWRGRRVGSFGTTAAFSFQSSKLLTAGEGGAAVSRDAGLANDLQQIRADGRISTDVRGAGFPDLRPGAGQQGHNYCMTEVQAAILSASLPALDDQNDVRRRGALHLEEMLEDIAGVRTVRRRNDPRVGRETFWHLPLQIDSDEFGGATAERVRALLSDLSGLYLEPIGAPMPQHPLYRPALYRRFPPEHVARLSVQRGDLPSARRISESCFTVPHHAFLSDHAVLESFASRLSVLQRVLRAGGPDA